MTGLYERPGTDSKVQQGRRCLLSVLQRITVARLRLDGSRMGIRQSLKELCSGQCAFIGTVTAVIGPIIFGFKTAARSSCTSYRHPASTAYVTVATMSLV